MSEESTPKIALCYMCGQSTGRREDDFVFEGEVGPLCENCGGPPAGEHDRLPMSIFAAFDAATTHAELADLVWASRALIDDDAHEAPFFTAEAIARDVIYSQCLGLYFQNAQRILGRSPWPVEVDEIESGFCAQDGEMRKREGMERGQRVLRERFPELVENASLATQSSASPTSQTGDGLRPCPLEHEVVFGVELTDIETDNARYRNHLIRCGDCGLEFEGRSPERRWGIPTHHPAQPLIDAWNPGVPEARTPAGLHIEPVQYQSAVSGLWYDVAGAAGDVCAIKIHGRIFHIADRRVVDAKTKAVLLGIQTMAANDLRLERVFICHSHLYQIEADARAELERLDKLEATKPNEQR